MKIPKLEISMIPKCNYGVNVRTLAPTKWEVIRREVLARAYYKCSICDDYGERLHCHEIWRLKDGMQTLIGFEAVCPACHAAHHFGRSIIEGQETEVVDHLMKVNGWNTGQVYEYINKKVIEWDRIGALQYKINIEYADEFLKTCEDINAAWDGWDSQKMKEEANK